MGRNWVFRFSPRPNIQMRRERLFPMQKGKLEGKKIEEDFFPQRFFFFLLEGNRNRERYEYCFAHKSEEGKAKVFLFSGPPKLLFSDFCTFVSLQMFRKYAEEKSAAEERGIFILEKSCLGNSCCVHSFLEEKSLSYMPSTPSPAFPPP